jgi:hypothetical protein
MSLVPSISYLYLLEISRNERSIDVALKFAKGKLVEHLQWDENSILFGKLEALQNPNGDYTVSLLLKEIDGERTFCLNFDSKLLLDDQAFFGSVDNTADGVQLFADQEGGYSVYIYQDGRDYTQALYDHLLTYNDWALKNGYLQVERSSISIKSICEAFPQLSHN